MAQILIRDLDKKTVERLKRRARENRRSLQGEARAILESAAARATPERIRAMLEKWDRHWGTRRFDDSAKLIREGRDER